MGSSFAPPPIFANPAEFAGMPGGFSSHTQEDNAGSSPNVEEDPWADVDQYDSPSSESEDGFFTPQNEPIIQSTPATSTDTKQPQTRYQPISAPKKEYQAPVSKTAERRVPTSGPSTVNGFSSKSKAPNRRAIDLAASVKGMYRILDLISEQGSGGLVDKVIIAQDSLREFINMIRPGAYVSLTKVDFKALDQLSLRPIGVYGSKAEIVRLLLSIGAVDNFTAGLLLAHHDGHDPSEPNLRSGLYIVIPSNPGSPRELLYLLYWPEDTTWNDGAVTSVRRNRITFMRYLTKITDQVVALISPEHSKTMVWRDDARTAGKDSRKHKSDRLFTFEVAKTNEQEENVTTRPGFTMTSRSIAGHLAAEYPVDPELFMPRLISGETTQAFLTTKYIPATTKVDEVRNKSLNAPQLKEAIATDTLHLNEALGEDSINALVNNGLKFRFRLECEAWKKRKQELRNLRDSAIRKEEEVMKQKLANNVTELEVIIRDVVFDNVIHAFPIFTRDSLGYPDTGGDSSEELTIDRWAQLVTLYPRIAEGVRKTILEAKLDSISLRQFKTSKDRLLAIEVLFDKRDDLDEVQRREVVDIIWRTGDLQAATRKFLTDPAKPDAQSWGIGVPTWFTGGGSSSMERQFTTECRQLKNSTPDAQFLAALQDMANRDPYLRAAVDETTSHALTSLQGTISKLVKTLNAKAAFVQQEECKKHIQRHASITEENDLRESRVGLIRQINEHAQSGSLQRKLFIDALDVMRSQWSQDSYRITARQESLHDPALEYRVHVIGLTTDDRQSLQLDSKFIPSPKVQDSLSQSFQLPVGHKILHAQLLEKNKFLLIVDDRNGNFLVFLEDLSAIEGAISRQRPKKLLNRDKIGQDFVLAFDETRRMLAVCASTKLQLHTFVFDEDFASLRASGTSVNLVPWYNDGPVSICHVCFVSGSEEILLIDTHAHARIFSLVTQLFRPASLHLPHLPVAVYSSPDSSCLLLLTVDGDEKSMRAYHWSTFGSTEGILLDLPELPACPLTLSSLGNRNSIHLIGLDVPDRKCRSVALDITRKVTEFSFKEKGARQGRNEDANITQHNCLIDCHAEVWTRFPVVPAVRRQTIVSSGERLPKALVFVSDRDHGSFSPHFAELIQSFESTTRKPTGDELANIRVDAMAFNSFAIDTVARITSRFRAGEWLVDLLCLIPIHIAITYENRFVPLKDGVTSADLERSLLGAEVSRIVDSLSFGWYESLFQSYMASKPVKVVSSMGEQSVGKSFALNHLVDTSFAGSAMRTTEGVWMSVTPTEDELIVALDFEGVHSIERSAQEDTLLVLFNTAISNLVLFRNNFAISRDITGLFQSFQSSSTVLDPAANPSLFQSTLVIIIKDVTDSDTSEIAREFSLKFQKIVQDEQDTNFITRLHAGKLNIIPWPVIESSHFYELFPEIKQHLDEQHITHPAAGEFLHTLKTLMAKLKANDWGALSQTMAAHRAQRLLSILPIALEFGLSEVVPESEFLKNFDTDVVIDRPDTLSRFFLQQGSDNLSATQEAVLAGLRADWVQDHPRQEESDVDWISYLSAYLDHVVDLRIEHVREWISSNLQRFKARHANIEELRRRFDTAAVELKANVQLCRMQCLSCHLLCLQGRLHDGPHNCLTPHQCIKHCDFADDHPDGGRLCGFPAGHSGKHLCVVNEHLCGEQCQLSGRQGCMEDCTKAVGHTDEGHLCSAIVHTCGEPCALSHIQLEGGETYTCPGACCIPSQDAHEYHVCDNRMCPVMCQLCKRLCSNDDHLHGLEGTAVHLCGQVHACSAFCSAEGFCEINTAPQSIEATFTGRHETFRYTKYSQVAKHLQCIIPIPPGEIEHVGTHSHSLEDDVFHYCKSQCETCGYYCTLPRGHPQQEHDTSHGSMSKTRWTVDGPDGTHLELDGRKFATNDDGAPMMCNLVCQSMGRHAHIDLCRAVEGTPCEGAEIEHISARMMPNPNTPKDWITHSLHWRRIGFKDPYSRDDQAHFAKCDAMCGGPEHAATATTPAQPSFCTMPIFHARLASHQDPLGGLGYVSNDGHSFLCRNPIVMQQAFHIIFVIDRSGSMGCTDRRPLSNTPATTRITRTCNNRLGAVYSSLHAFWMSRHAATAATARRDAYSVILFESTPLTAFANDFTRAPDDLLTAVLAYGSTGGTNFTAALGSTQALMQQHWSTERSPVVIFLSDGQCGVNDETVENLCRTSVRLGKPLSFHAVSFGPDGGSTILRRMARIALDVQTRAPQDPLAAAASVDSSFSEALDTVRLAETFLGIAESLRKPRGSLVT